jgi:hypothetical protein
MDTEPPLGRVCTCQGVLALVNKQGLCTSVLCTTVQKRGDYRTEVSGLLDEQNRESEEIVCN